MADLSVEIDGSRFTSMTDRVLSRLGVLQNVALNEARSALSTLANVPVRTGHLADSFTARPGIATWSGGRYTGGDPDVVGAHIANTARYAFFVFRGTYKDEAQPPDLRYDSGQFANIVMHTTFDR